MRAGPNDPNIHELASPTAIFREREAAAHAARTKLDWQMRPRNHRPRRRPRQARAIEPNCRLRAGNFYVAIEGEAFRRIVAPWCLSYHPPSPP